MSSSSSSVLLKDSIATRLLRAVFSLYLIIAFTGTTIHMAAEYFGAEDEVNHDLKIFQKTFFAALSTEVYNLDEDALFSILQGIIEIPMITGVKIEGFDGEQMGALGLVRNLDKQPVFYNEFMELKERSSDLLSQFIEHSFPLVFVTATGKRVKVGKCTLYSSTSIVFRKVQSGFLFIIGNAIFKTIALWVIFLYIGKKLLSLPLSRLTRATDQLDLDSLENIKVDIQTSGKTELKVLERSFNAMIQSLLKAREELQEINRHLEQKVSERTEDLQQAIHKVRQTNEKLENLSKKLSKYLSPQVYQNIFTGKKDVKLESYRKELTIFFSDIQGFTNITDSMESEALASLLNNYLDEMATIALHFGGTLDKFIGDAVMIFFGDPETKGKEKDALACVLMALEMRERMKSLQQQWNDQGITHLLKIRMGINTGYCTAGNFGSESRLDYTIIGGQVNLASRLESCAEADQILISHKTWSLIKDEINCEKKEVLTVKGIAQPVQTYQVIDQKNKETKVINELKKEFEGFNLSVDLVNADKKKVLETLKQAIEDLN